MKAIPVAAFRTDLEFSIHSDFFHFIIHRERKRGHPLKGPLSRNKLPRSRKNEFFLTRDNVRIYLRACDQPPLSASVISFAMCRYCFTAPVIHQDQGLSLRQENQSSRLRSEEISITLAVKQTFLFSYPNPCPCNTDPENLRFHAVSNWYVLQILWLSANPLVVHDLGSKETENHWAGRLPIKSGGCANPIAGSPPRPILRQRVSVDQMPPGLLSHSMPPVPVYGPVRCAPP
jgi:hypothetical protein